MIRSSPNRGPLPAIRHRHALALLQRNGAVSCEDLRMAFRISEATARRDIQMLVQRGLALRVHGGAVLPERILGRPCHSYLGSTSCPGLRV
jgi:DeoR/GlpR family transcriptional regulator of sugar metabolism